MGRPTPYILTSSVAAMTAKGGMKGGGGEEKAALLPVKGSWNIGLINTKYKYLSAETFGFKINANGKAMGKKQVWTLEPSGDGDSICIRSHLHKLLAVDHFGNVTCENEEKDDSAKFEISVCDDFSGRWAFRSVSRGYFLGASLDSLVCAAKSPGEAELWYFNLAARPQVNLRSLGRKRFARLSEDRTEIQVEENVPWGSDTLFTLEFREEANKYALHTSNNCYLMKDGRLVPELSKDCLFACEYHSGHLALRDQEGLYLSPMGSRAVLKTRSNAVTKDELFSLEDSLPQASFQAVTNQRFVSIKLGVDVTANQEEIGDHETFQLEFSPAVSKWNMRTREDKYFSLGPGGGLQAAETRGAGAALIDLEWLNDCTVAFKAENGKYICTKKSGHLFADADMINERSKFFFYLTNRPVLVLKCDQGYVGYKAANSPFLECNKTTFTAIQVERAEQGQVHFRGRNGKYCRATKDGLVCDSPLPHSFYLEVREPTRLCIKTSESQYVCQQKNGGLTLGGQESATRWQF